AFLTAALIGLYEATGKLRWIEEAIRLDGVLAEHYEDPAGGFFLTSDDHEQLLARAKPAHDGAEPSGNSVAALNLLRLYEFTGEDRYRERAEKALQAFATILSQRPAALSEMLLALDFHHDTPKEIVIVTSGPRKQAEPLLARLRNKFVPNRVLTVVAQGEELEAHSKVVPLVAHKVARQGEATAYVCEKRVCELPTTDPDTFAKQVASPAPEARAIDYLRETAPLPAGIAEE
ncbi:MAG: thioredoxin domain-containing protein, partial [bacterium]|nr:thioredoxin domain-containing protein [bacterium]